MHHEGLQHRHSVRVTIATTTLLFGRKDGAEFCGFGLPGRCCVLHVCPQRDVVARSPRSLEANMLRVNLGTKRRCRTKSCAQIKSRAAFTQGASRERGNDDKRRLGSFPLPFDAPKQTTADPGGSGCAPQGVPHLLKAKLFKFRPNVVPHEHQDFFVLVLNVFKFELWATSNQSSLNRLLEMCGRPRTCVQDVVFFCCCLLSVTRNLTLA